MATELYSFTTEEELINVIHKFINDHKSIDNINLITPDKFQIFRYRFDALVKYKTINFNIKYPNNPFIQKYFLTKLNDSLNTYKYIPYIYEYAGTGKSYINYIKYLFYELTDENKQFILTKYNQHQLVKEIFY